MTLLDIVIALPLIGFFVILFLPASTSRMAAMAIALVIFIASLGLIPGVMNSPTKFGFETNAVWIAYPPINYHVGIDGLGLWLVILTTFLTPIAVLVSWNYITHRLKEYYAFLILLELGVIGVFVSLDLFLFYVFWEISLVPMYFLIGIWGYSRRIYAAVKFFLYTMAGSVLMLAAIIYLYNKTGTFDYPTLLGMLNSGQLLLSHMEASLLFLAFFVAFAIKVPLFPLHTWLPDAHVEAPTAGSVMLASVMLKMGTYGIVRFCVPLFPNAARENAPWIITLAIIGIIYGALVALVQPNIKKLVAYSSVSHLGFVVLGVFSFNQQGLDGAVYQMLNHGISTGALFMLVGMMYERRHSLEIKDYGGVATAAPWLSTMFLITTLASVGLPLLNNFIGEFLVLQGAAIANFNYAVFAAIGVILSAGYMLWMYQRVFFGRAPGMPEPTVAGHGGHGHSAGGHGDHGVIAKDAHAADAADIHGSVHYDPDTAAQASPEMTHDHSGFHMPDLSTREWAILIPMTAMMIWMGVAPQSFLPTLSAADSTVLEKLGQRVQITAPAQTTEVANAR